MLQEKQNRKKKLKQIDVDEYEDEIWLAYVEPQYENEYSRMLATMRSQAHTNPLLKSMGRTENEADV
jgi:hypothetical protein